MAFCPCPMRSAFPSSFWYVLSGATLYLAPPFRSGGHAHSLEKDRLTVVLAPPSMFSLLLEYAKLKGFESLRFLRFASLPRPALRSPRTQIGRGKHLRLVLHNGYGVTECSPNIAQRGWKSLVWTPRLAGCSQGSRSSWSELMADW